MATHVTIMISFAIRQIEFPKNHKYLLILLNSEFMFLPLYGLSSFVNINSIAFNPVLKSGTVAGDPEHFY